MYNSIIKLSIHSFLLLAFFSSFSFSQTNFAETRKPDESKVEVISKWSSMQSLCLHGKNGQVDASQLKRYLKDKRCSILWELKVNFSEHTLLSYRVGGDCFMKVNTSVFRNDKAKKYRVVIDNYWGRCRAGGHYEGWIVIDKIPDGYKLEFVENKIDSIGKPSHDLVLNSGTNRKDFVKALPADLKGCVPIYGSKEIVINNKETYLKSIRRDTQTESCKKNIKTLDFNKYTYLGIEINSGYCRYPRGLKYQAVKDTSNRKYILKISYDDPGSRTCRALSRYDLWVRVPKLPAGYSVKFEVTPIRRKRKLFY